MLDWYFGNLLEDSKIQNSSGTTFDQKVQAVHMNLQGNPVLIK